MTVGIKQSPSDQRIGSVDLRILRADSDTKVERIIDADYGEVLRPLARRAHEESIFSVAPFSDKKFNKFIQYSNDTNRHLFLCGKHKDTAFSYLYAQAGEHYISEGVNFVTVISIFIDPKMRSTYVGGKANLLLLRSLTMWAIERSCAGIIFNVTAGGNAAKSDKYFRRLKCVTLGGNYLLKLK